MSGRQLRIVPYNGNRAYKYYLDGYKVNGKRRRLFFKEDGRRPSETRGACQAAKKRGARRSWYSLSLGPQSVVNYRAFVHALFEHCLKRHLVESNPIGAIDKVKLVDKAPEILTPEQLFRLLSAAPFDLLPLLAIQAFAGLRTEEAMRLDWSEVDQVRGHITVSAKKQRLRAAGWFPSQAI
jgi:integrase